jgi:hypothetical protein
VTKNWAHRACWEPIEAAGPVIGAATPIVLVLPQRISAVSALFGPAVTPDRSGLAVPPNAAAVAASAATRAAAKKPFFIPTSSSGVLLGFVS